MSFRGITALYGFPLYIAFEIAAVEYNLESHWRDILHLWGVGTQLGGAGYPSPHKYAYSREIPKPKSNIVDVGVATKEPSRTQSVQKGAGKCFSQMISALKISSSTT